MARGRWFVAALILLLALGLTAGCDDNGSGNGNGDGNDGEDLYPDSQRVVLVEMFTQTG
jgi:hypothetical protein